MIEKVMKLGLLLGATALCSCQADYRGEVVSENKDTPRVVGKGNENVNQKDNKANEPELSLSQDKDTNLRVSTEDAGSSKPLSEISKEPSKDIECEAQFKNENGVCEVPNQSFPKELIEKSSDDVRNLDDKDNI